MFLETFIAFILSSVILLLELQDKVQLVVRDGQDGETSPVQQSHVAQFFVLVHLHLLERDRSPEFPIKLDVNLTDEIKISEDTPWT